MREGGSMGHGEYLDAILFVCVGKVEGVEMVVWRRCLGLTFSCKGRVVEEETKRCLLMILVVMPRIHPVFVVGH